MRSKLSISQSDPQNSSDVIAMPARQRRRGYGFGRPYYLPFRKILGYTVIHPDVDGTENAFLVLDTKLAISGNFDVIW